MCGIAATVDVHRRGRAAPWAVPFIGHRGPDGEGIYLDPARNVALEHTRLAVIDPDNPAANQPFIDRSGRWVVVYNGELFNFRELRSELEDEGLAFRTESDTEVLIEAFAHEGVKVLSRLRGMFAFVAYDRWSGDVFAARDQIGVKPLYFRMCDGVFSACSELRPLLSLPGRESSFDPAGVVEFLAFGDNPGERTLVSGVRKLLPGHFLHISDGRLSVHEYWDVVGEIRHGDLVDDPADELLAKLDAAVSAALVSDVPVGLMLSGGIDSSVVAALATHHVPAQKLTAYSVAFGRSDDEAGTAARFARDLGMRHRVVAVTEHDIGAEFENWLADLDYPSGNPTWIASWFIARAAAGDAIKVLLSGDGGDELFGGYTRWMTYLRFHDRVWARLPARGRRVAGAAIRPLVKGLAGDIARRAARAFRSESALPRRPPQSLPWRRRSSRRAATPPRGNR
jgi:asparagine synthase (glutamine-hydrolysing)